jgi:ribonuclease BN (tRNA processing enzyme)
MVELGNGNRFFFDFGPGCLRNIIAMGVSQQLMQDIFLTHLHIDHYHDIPYLLPFSAWSGRWKPLRVHGPSGRTPELGTQGMIDGMNQMLRWHFEAFDVFPIGDGYEVDVNEFDWKDENGICYDKDGVTIRHWRRSHAKDGATAYRLDWHDTGLSFVWTGDGRPDELTLKYAEGVDVFVTECQTDTARIINMKYGLPEWLYNYTVDTHHTPHYAVGYMMKQINPRLGMVTHLEYEDDLLNEVIAGIRVHWDGFFMFGAPDVMVVNVTKDAIWGRMAVLPELSGVNVPNPKALLGIDGPLPEEVPLPSPRNSREQQQEQYTRDMEIDPHKYYPPDVYREPMVKLPKDLKFTKQDLEAMMAAQPIRPDK